MSVNCNNFLAHHLKHVFWVLKRTGSLKLSFEHPQHMFWMRNKENSFPKHTLIWRPVVWEQDSSPTRQFTGMVFEDISLTLLKTVHRHF